MGLADREPDVVHDERDRRCKYRSGHEGFAFDDCEACEPGTVVQRNGTQRSVPVSFNY